MDRDCCGGSVLLGLSVDSDFLLQRPILLLGLAGAVKRGVSLGIDLLNSVSLLLFSLENSSEVVGWILIQLGTNIVLNIEICLMGNDVCPLLRSIFLVTFLV